MTSLLKLLAVVFLHGCLCGSALARDTYRVIELGPRQYLPRALNDAGQVTGYLSEVLPNGQPLNTAFVFTPGEGVRLLDPAQSFKVSYGMDINDRGEVALSADARAYRWDSRSGFVGVGSLVFDNFTTPFAINNAGVVTGESWIRGVSFSDPGHFRAFVARPGRPLEDIRPDDRSSVGMAINDRGQVAGSAQFSGTAFSGFVFDARSGMTPIPGTRRATAINDAGWVGGQTPDNDAFLYTPDGVLTPLGTLGLADSFVNGINNAGTLVGHAQTDLGPPNGTVTRVPFIYTPDEGIADLNSLLTGADRAHYRLWDAHDINNRGWIAATAFGPRGTVGVLLVQCRAPRGLLSRLGF